VNARPAVVRPGDLTWDLSSCTSQHANLHSHGRTGFCPEREGRICKRCPDPSVGGGTPQAKLCGRSR
jgi:hypothetical protein